MGEWMQRGGSWAAAAGVVVPSTAIAAHGLVAGALPGPAGMALLVAVGLLVATVLRPLGTIVARQRIMVATAVVTGVLASGQLLGHQALAVAAPTHGVEHLSGPAMLALHLVAIPLSAILVVLAAGMLEALRDRVRQLCSVCTEPSRDTPGAQPNTWVWVAVAGGLSGAGGQRAPPELGLT